MGGELLRRLGAWFGTDRNAGRHALVGRPDLWRMKRAFQIDFLRRQGLQPWHRVLDIGCGSLRGGAALIAYLEPMGYSGIDVRANVLAEALKELQREKLAGKRAELTLVDDMAELDLRRRFNVLWAFSVLFHLADPILEACFVMASRHLDLEGIFFANVILGEGLPGEWQGFPVASRKLETYQAVAQRHGLHASVVGRLADLGHHSGDPSQDNQCMLAFSHSVDAGLRRAR